ncbi:hypothetical protein K439DRAFT_1620756 [Ramaria rubella]|nr:hypothetical protein K439DRAFT_1620756 [Ramaria rubella]
MSNTVPSGDPFLPSNDHDSNASEVEPNPPKVKPKPVSVEERINCLKKDKLTSRSSSGSSSTLLRSQNTTSASSAEPDFEEIDFIDPLLCSSAAASFSSSLSASGSSTLNNKGLCIRILKITTTSRGRDTNQTHKSQCVREALLCTLLVNLIDSQENCQDDYTIPPALDTNIKRCMMGTLISPILTAYKGNLTSMVIAAMRALAIDNVPDDRDTHKIWVIAERIRHFAIKGCNIIKTKVTHNHTVVYVTNIFTAFELSTMKAKIEDVPVHIADVSCSITWALNGDLKITVPLQVRLAFLCAILAENNFTDYWGDVDDRLCKWEADYGNQLSLHMLLIFEADQEDYPRPPKTKIVQYPTSAASKLSEWQHVSN